jgi:hypothetical protein
MHRRKFNREFTPAEPRTPVGPDGISLCKTTWNAPLRTVRGRMIRSLTAKVGGISGISHQLDGQGTGIDRRVAAFG